LWDRLEKLTSTAEGVYETKDSALLDDFAANYQIASQLASASGKTTRLEMTLANVGASAMSVTFKLHYRIGASENYAIYPMHDFGTSNLIGVDLFMASQLS
jgi:hypothetical protein